MAYDDVEAFSLDLCKAVHYRIRPGRGMMKGYPVTAWNIYHGDIFEVEADVLVCSANVFLTLSGGVGGELLRRHGQEMQEPLSEVLSSRDIRHVKPGEVIVAPPGGSPYKAILHAVAVDGMYDSSSMMIGEVVLKSFDATAAVGGGSVVMPALATGYGHLTMEQFADGIAAIMNSEHPRITDVTIAIPDKHHATTVRARLGLP